MQRIYIFITIAALIVVISYSKPIREFFTRTEKSHAPSSPEHHEQNNNNYHEQLGIELYRAAARLSDLQGKAKLLELAKENEGWFNREGYVQLDELTRATEEELKKAESEYQKIKEEYAKITVRKMLLEFSNRK